MRAPGEDEFNRLFCRLVGAELQYHRPHAAADAGYAPTPAGAVHLHTIRIVGVTRSSEEGLRDLRLTTEVLSEGRRRRRREPVVTPSQGRKEASAVPSVRASHSLVLSTRREGWSEGASEGGREGGSEGARERGGEGASERGSEGAREGCAGPPAPHDRAEVDGEQRRE